jgi:RHS repeat-associated protein
MVRSTISDTQGITTTGYVGNYQEWVEGENSPTNYYHFGGRRVAMRTSAGVSYLHADQLQSTSNTTGQQTSGPEYYYPYGAKRGGSDVATPYRYTGQRWEARLGLYYYNARWYDPTMRRFAQPDTIVPEPGNPQSLNRYSYCLNNPVRYSDPTGHYTFEEDPDDPAIFSSAQVRSQYYWTHPEAAVLPPVSNAEIRRALTSLIWAPVAAVGVVAAVEVVASGASAVVGIARGVAAAAAGAVAADGDPTNEARAVLDAVGADGDPLNEVRTGTNVVYRYIEGGVTRYVGITNEILSKVVD